MFIASPDGRLGVVDGMKAVLAAGGSGDLLAGLCAGIAARVVAAQDAQGAAGADLYACALAGASLLIASAEGLNRFADPLEIGDRAAELAGRAWLEESDGG
jgi:NAD(P)H-hydrate repair Nnr-like enzyme with NAD(P)H-hydrate dehydratase domain